MKLLSLRQAVIGRRRFTLIALRRRRFPDHSAAPFNSRVKAAHERVHASSEITASTVGLSSTVRRKRYHHEEIIRRASFPATSPRSRITNPKPPACNNRSAALKEFSRLPAQRTHSSRSKSTPAAVAAVGANTSFVSTSAQVSSCLVA